MPAETTMLTFRLSESTLGEIDRIRDHLRSLTHTDYTRVDAVRYAVSAALEVLDSPRLVSPKKSGNKSRKSA